VWQDYVMAVVQWFFFLSLTPTLLHPTNKPPLLTSVPTAVLMLVTAYTVWTLGLWNSCLSSFAVAAAWAFIGFQRYELDRRKKPGG